MRRKYLPWILALTLSASIPFAAISEEITGDASTVTSTDDNTEGNGDQGGSGDQGKTGRLHRAAQAAA